MPLDLEEGSKIFSDLSQWSCHFSFSLLLTSFSFLPFPLKGEKEKKISVRMPAEIQTWIHLTEKCIVSSHNSPVTYSFFPLNFLGILVIQGIYQMHNVFLLIDQYTLLKVWNVYKIYIKLFYEDAIFCDFWKIIYYVYVIDCVFTRTFIFITIAISFLLTIHYMQNVKSAIKVLSFTLCMHLNKQL